MGHPVAENRIRIAVFNLSGCEMLSEGIECPAPNGDGCTKTINVRSLPPGAYILCVTLEYGTPQVKKLIIK